MGSFSSLLASHNYSNLRALKAAPKSERASILALFDKPGFRLKMRLLLEELEKYEIPEEPAVPLPSKCMSVRISSAESLPGTGTSSTPSQGEEFEIESESSSGDSDDDTKSAIPFEKVPAITASPASLQSVAIAPSRSEHVLPRRSNSEELEPEPTVSVTVMHAPHPSVSSGSSAPSSLLPRGLALSNLPHFPDSDDSDSDTGTYSLAFRVILFFLIDAYYSS